MKCSICNEKIDIVRWIDDNNEPICEECASEMHLCECGRKTSNNNAVCDRCAEEIYSRLMNSYSTKPLPRFVNYNYGNIVNGKHRTNEDKLVDWMSTNRKEIKKTRYYGLELEYSNISSAFTKIILSDYYDNQVLYNKSDGSLSDGVEIVTSPMDYKCCRMFINEFGSKLDELKANKVTTYNAGLHIHVSRNSLNMGTIMKLSLLLNSSGSDPSNGIWKTLCNRANMEYCKVGHVNIKELLTNKETEKYSAVNLKPKNTIEFRIFSATLDGNELLKYFTMVNTLIDYCECTPVRDVNSMGYLNYVMSSLPPDDALSMQVKAIIETTDNIVSNNGLILERISFSDFIKSEDDIEKAINNAMAFVEKTKGMNKQQLNECIKSYKDNDTILDIPVTLSSTFPRCNQVILNLEAEITRGIRKFLTERIFQQCV